MMAPPHEDPDNESAQERMHTAPPGKLNVLIDLDLEPQFVRQIASLDRRGVHQTRRCFLIRARIR